MSSNSYSATNHYFQSAAWAAARLYSPWKAVRLELKAGPIFVYRRRTLLGSVLHIPGYCPSPGEVTELTESLRKAFPAALLCKLETCMPDDAALRKAVAKAGWLKGRPTQYAFTVQFDLAKDEDALGKDMKKRARNEINRARKNNVHVREVSPDDEHLETMYQLLTGTAARKRFSVHDKQFAFAFWRNIRSEGRLRLFFAEHEGLILSAAVIIISEDGKKAWYKEGASTTAQPGVNAPRLLLWEIALLLKKSGVTVFDLGGIPDPATYEQSTMKGVFIFKTAYTAGVTTMMPTYELPLSPVRYRLWPRIELLLRKLAQKRQTSWY